MEKYSLLGKRSTEMLRGEKEERTRFAMGGCIEPRRGLGAVLRVVLGVASLLAFILFTSLFGRLLAAQHLPNMWKGIPPAGLLSAGLVGSSSATLLYVSSYAGTITTLNLTLPEGDTAAATLETVSTSTGCGQSPSWLTLDYSKSFLFCTDEGLTGENGGLSSLFTNSNGTLTHLSTLEVIVGPVAIAQYGVGGHGLALAQYSGSTVTAIGMTPEGGLEMVQNETYTLEQPGPNASRQEAPHPHDAILDPTASFVLVPDLGADLVRVYQANPDDLSLTDIEPLVAAPGSGPRHGVFKTVLDKTYFYLISELANTITGYDVTYNENKTLSFAELFVIPTHGEAVDLPEGTGAAEILLSPDQNFLIVSSRWENSTTIASFDSSNGTIPSDPLITFSVDRETGNLTKLQEFPAGGQGPRQFSINAAGNLIAVGLQADGRVVIIERDVKTGLLKDFLAHANIEGEITAAIFYEDSYA